MYKLLVDNDIDIDVDEDGDVYQEGMFTMIRVNTWDETMKSIQVDPTEARRVGKQMIAFADRYDARVVKAKERGKAIRTKLRELDRAA